MFSYPELKKRIPEPEEVMEDEDAIQYFKARYTPRKKGSSLIVAIDAFGVAGKKQSKILVLDVGCGWGDLILQAKSLYPKAKFTGIDASKSMIKIAKKLFQNKEKNIKVFNQYAESIKFKDCSFDLVICKDTFHHFKNPVNVLKEMYRVAKEGCSIYRPF